MANIPLQSFGISASARWAFSTATRALLRLRLAALGAGAEVITDALTPQVQWVDLDAHVDPTSGTAVDSFVWSPPFPITVVMVEGACVSAGGATGTVDVHHLPSGGSYATVLSAAIDVKTGTTTYAAGTVVDTSSNHKVATTGKIKAIFTSGSGGTLAGARCRIYFVRQDIADA